MYKAKLTAGYSLVEVLIAITIMLLAIAGPLTIAQKGLQSSFFARDQLVAFMLAQEGVEAILNIRNEEVIAEVHNGAPIDLSYANLWTWADSAGSLASCFTANGCGFTASDNSFANNFVACGSNGSGCEIYFDAANTSRARYNTNGVGEQTEFTRVIKLNEVAADQEVIITSTVTWYPTVFGGSAKTVTLTSSVMNVYGI